MTSKAYLISQAVDGSFTSKSMESNNHKYYKKQVMEKIIKSGHIKYNNGVEKHEELYENLFNRFYESICLEVNDYDIKKVRREIKTYGLYRLKHNYSLGTMRQFYIDSENKILITIDVKTATTLSVTIQFPCMSDNKEILERRDSLFRSFFKYRVMHKKKVCVSVVAKGPMGYYLENLPIKDTLLDIEDNYNDDFLEVNEIIQNGINDDSKNNLVILQSEPGCGKTYYIRKLIKSNPKLNFVFMHPSLASDITNEYFISFAIKNLKSKIIIIEDSELIISKRGGTINNNGNVSTLLNLTDGFMKDILNLKIICTANCKMSEIDEALLRKGRILAKYEFKKLSKDKCNNIFQKKGLEHFTEEDMILADVYNVCDSNFSEKKSKIGF